MDLDLAIDGAARARHPAAVVGPRDVPVGVDGDDAAFCEKARELGVDDPVGGVVE